MPSTTSAQGALSRRSVVASVAAVLLGVAASACQSTPGQATATRAALSQVTPSQATPSQKTSSQGGSPVPKQWSAPPAMTIDQSKRYTATIKTSDGDMTAELFVKDAPITVNNFVFLAQQGFYNGNTFYRVIADKQGTVHFVQAGDPTGLGTGGPGYTLPSEPTPTLASSFDSAGVLAAARPPGAGQPNNGSQFFITTTPEPTFDGQYTVFGKVLSGLDVLSKLPPRDPLAQQNPPAGVRITSISILSS